MGRPEILHRDLKRERERGREQRSEQQVSEDRRGDKEWSIYTGIDVRHLFRQTGRTESGDPT